ncbi:MAG: hypothetical protein IV092_26235 [Burkholderiaceae bacterium]|nr:hypothetical protein [Burkholderiaceae bacterium]
MGRSINTGGMSAALHRSLRGRFNAERSSSQKLLADKIQHVRRWRGLAEGIASIIVLVQCLVVVVLKSNRGRVTAMRLTESTGVGDASYQCEYPNEQHRGGKTLLG